MSRYAYLSTPDPELAALLSALPAAPGPLDGDDVLVQRARASASFDTWNEFLSPRVPAESAYTVRDHQVPVEGGEITVRNVVPRGAAEGGTYPVLVWFHGGGWTLGDLKMDDARLKIIAVTHQLSVVNVGYRLIPDVKFPVPWEDSFTATRWVAQNARRLSASLEKGFLIGGSSAGGNIAAGIAHRARDDPVFSRTPITGQLLQVSSLLHIGATKPEEWKSELLSADEVTDAPILTRDAKIRIINTVGAPPEDTRISVLFNPSREGLPAAYFHVAGWDPNRDEQLLYARLLEEAGVKTKVDVYPGVPHGFEVGFPRLKISVKAEEDLQEGIAWLLSQGRV